MSGRSDIVRVAALGEGGMGAVCRAKHVPSGVEVAVKTVLADVAQAERFRAGFAREVRAIAALEHNAILHIHDHGVIGPGEEAFGEVGSPYMVLELADQGSLEGWEAPDWSAVNGVLVELLEGLAHAHARDLSHLDLKPGNLLMCGPTHLRPGLKIADFGLARFVGDNHEERRVSGTPGFMAPEQFLASSGRIGPGSDLYAVGCIAWLLVSRVAVFEADSVQELGRLHLNARVPSLVPRMPVPQDLEAWLAWLLAKSPEDRPATAALALTALKDLQPAPSKERQASRPASTRRASHETFDIWSSALPSVHGSLSPKGDQPGSVSLEPPPLEVVMGERGYRAPFRIPGLGRQLMKVRVPPYIGRHDVRSQLWEAFLAVRRGAICFRYIEGPSGSGTSRLADWVALSAAEFGLAQRRRIDIEEPGELNGWLERTFQLHGLEAPARRARLGQSSRMGQVLIDLDEKRVSGPSGIAAWLVAEAQSCPQVVVLDDRDRSPFKVELARQLHHASLLSPLPVLVLSTGPAHDAQRLGAGVEAAVSLEALTLDESKELLERVLKVSPTALSALHRDAHGRPGVMLGMLEAWLEHGALRMGPEGYSVDLEALASVRPSGSLELQRMVQRAFEGLSDAAMQAAALLVVSKGSADWEAQLGPLGLSVAGWLERWVELGIVALARDRRWSFTDPAYQPHLLAALEEGGWADTARRRWVSVLQSGVPTLEQHQACVRLLADLQDWSQVVEVGMKVGQLATHRATERTAEVMNWVRLAMARAGIGNDDPRLQLWRTQMMAVLANLNHPTLDPLRTETWEDAHRPDRSAEYRLEVWLREAQLRSKEGQVEAGLELANRVVAQRPDDIRGWTCLGRLNLMVGDFAQALRTMKAALEVKDADPFQQATALTMAAEAHRCLGDLEASRGMHERAWRIGTEKGWSDALISSLNLALIELELGQLKQAQMRLADTEALARRRLHWGALLPALALRATCEARLGRWVEVDRCLSMVPSVIRILQVYDRDMALSYLSVVREALAAGRSSTANIAVELAEEQIAILGMDAERAELTALKAQLP